MKNVKYLANKMTYGLNKCALSHPNAIQLKELILKSQLIGIVMNILLMIQLLKGPLVALVWVVLFAVVILSIDIIIKRDHILIKMNILQVYKPN